MSGRVVTAPARTRLRSALLFLAVVWSIGAGFLALQALFLKVTDFSVAHLADTDIGLPKQSAAGTAHCREVLKNLARSENREQVNQSRYRAWSLGFQLGFADEMANGAAQDPGSIAKTLAQAQLLARNLGVPEVALPQGHTAYALRDFSVSLEEDPQCVSAALAERYSRQHASLYKFGAAVGVAMVYRIAVANGGLIFEPQIMVYGRMAGIPAELWQPLLETRIPVQPPSANNGAALTAIVSRIDNYVKTLD